MGKKLIFSDFRAGLDAELFCVLSKAVEELGMEWSAPEEPTRSCLDERFLLFPEVHD